MFLIWLFGVLVTILFFSVLVSTMTRRPYEKWYFDKYDYGETYINNFRIEKYILLKNCKFKIFIKKPESNIYWIPVFKDGEWIHKGPWIKEFNEITSKIEHNRITDEINKVKEEENRLKQEKELLLKLYKEK